MSAALARPAEALSELDRLDCEESLAKFFRRAWPEVEPGATYVHGWHLDALADHLEAVTRGEIIRLLINVPPGTSKPLASDTPVMTLDGWTRHGDLRPGDYVFAPDGQPRRVTGRTLDHVEPCATVRFNDGSEIVAGLAHEWDVERDVMSAETGWKRERRALRVETRDLVAGKRADRIRCTEPLFGVRRHYIVDPYVLGAWLGDGGSDGGMIYASALDVGHFSSLGEPALTREATDRGQAFYRIAVGGLCTRLRVLGLLGNKHVPEDYLLGSCEQRQALLQGLMDTDGHLDAGGACYFTNKNRALAEAVRYLAASLGCRPRMRERRSVLDGVDYGPHYQVAFTASDGVDPFRLPRKASRVRHSSNGRTLSRYVVAVEPAGDRLVQCISVEGGQYLAGRQLIATHNSLGVGVLWPAWEWGPKGLAHHRFVGASHHVDLQIRDNMRMRRLVKSDWYRTKWPVEIARDQDAKLKFENTETGFRAAIAATGLTGHRGDRLIFDDPHSVEGALSDQQRPTVIRVFQETVTTRMNDPKRSAIIVVMQRLHEDDLSGHILSQDLGYEHLCIPMRFEADRRCVTSIGFRDPRSADGELLDPVRFPEEVVERDERAMGSLACTPAESPVLMADLSLRPISEVGAGDVVIGFGPGEVRPGATHALTRLKPAVVKSTFCFRAPVVRITLDSGEVIRCTPDHKWYKRQRSDRPDRSGEYGPAKIGTALTRVCPTDLPELSAEDARLGGWLGGFFDADGSVSFLARHDNCKPVSQIKFYQGNGRNGPLCQKLEAALDHFGFDYRVEFDTRKDPSRGVNFEYRCYTLRGQSLPLVQRFMHVAQPTKWRDRMAEGALAAKFRMGRERVVSIEPDGEEDVYALETETGNYVVWGFASSNSAGQFQQRPTPRGGGMFPIDKFVPLDAPPAPGEIESSIRYWDKAGTDAKKAAKGGAQTAGVLMHKMRDGRYVITDCTFGQWAALERERMIRSTAETDGKRVKVYVEQEPGSGGKESAEATIRNLAGFSVYADHPTGAKEVRAEPYAAQVQGGNVYLLKGAWNLPFKHEHQAFPVGKTKDMVDAAAAAFNLLSGAKEASAQSVSIRGLI